MANIFETDGAFTITRLRTDDTAYLQGAVRPLGFAANPIALAEGPVVTGPTVAPGNAESWTLAVTMPAAPEVVWVVVEGNIKMGQNPATGSLVADMWLFMFGDLTDGAALRGPIFGPGVDIAQAINVASAGGFVRSIQLSTNNVPRSVWIPLDPDQTSAGWTPLFHTRMGATAVAPNELLVDLSHVRMVGYPVNLWGTGALWDGTRLRGS